jgi:hypothetical protein
MLPDNYLRKMKQDLAEADKMTESTHLEPEPELCDESQCDGGQSP